MPDPLTTTFAALADPTRRAMLQRLSQGDANVSDLARPFLDNMSLPAVTKHLKVLERAGLITKSREAQWRLCKLNPDPFREVAAWMEPYRRHMEESLDRLGEYLKTVTAPKPSTQTDQTHPTHETNPLSTKPTSIKKKPLPKAKGKKRGRQK
jgi:DNA-binding transcriptional ArsR family regulator